MSFLIKIYSWKYLDQKFSTSIRVQITTKLTKTEISGITYFFRISSSVDLACGSTMWKPITL